MKIREIESLSHVPCMMRIPWFEARQSASKWLLLKLFTVLVSIEWPLLVWFAHLLHVQHMNYHPNNGARML